MNDYYVMLLTAQGIFRLNQTTGETWLFNEAKRAWNLVGETR